jgi:predicted TPR repeat methyltransferase
MNNYWNDRYVAGGNSGAGSYGEYAVHKADVINYYIEKYEIKTISDFGCGDGNQISLLTGFEKYAGCDISPRIIEVCKKRFENDKRYSFYGYIHQMPSADLCMSLDVIYHIMDYGDYETYLATLFEKSDNYVLIFSSNHDRKVETVSHIHHRIFTKFVDEFVPNFKLVEEIENNLNTSAKFFLYEKI